MRNYRPESTNQVRHSKLFKKGLHRAISAVLGSKARVELFGTENPLGAVIQISNNRFRVIGVMASKGQTLGLDLDDTVYIPTARAGII